MPLVRSPEAGLTWCLLFRRVVALLPQLLAQVRSLRRQTLPGATRVLFLLPSSLLPAHSHLAVGRSGASQSSLQTTQRSARFQVSTTRIVLSRTVLTVCSLPAIPLSRTHRPSPAPAVYNSPGSGQFTVHSRRLFSDPPLSFVVYPSRAISGPSFRYHLRSMDMRVRDWRASFGG